MSDVPFKSRVNPADPALSADVGREKRRLLLPVSIGLAIVVAVAGWWVLTPHGPQPPVQTFESQELGCRFTFSSLLSGGPNFVRAKSGSLLTIERHSLYEAKRDFLAGLPDSLFPQVMIQIGENYSDIQEVGRSHGTLDGRKSLEVVMKARSNSFRAPTVITIVIAATDDWVYVLRGYADEDVAEQDRPLFDQVRETWKFL